MGKIIAICTSEKKGTKKFPIDNVNMKIDFGLEGDAHGGPGIRQVSLLDKAEIDDFNLRGGNVVHGDFGENLVTSGIDYKSLSLGDRLKIGDCILELSKFGKECHTRCQIYYRVGDCIMPKSGVFAIVITEGKISTGDEIELIK